jgi:hypothetical protein
MKDQQAVDTSLPAKTINALLVLDILNNGFSEEHHYLSSVNRAKLFKSIESYMIDVFSDHLDKIKNKVRESNTGVVILEGTLLSEEVSKVLKGKMSYLGVNVILDSLRKEDITILDLKKGPDKYKTYVLLTRGCIDYSPKISW